MQPYSIQFTHKALNDVQQTFDYYEWVQPGLGNKFRVQLKQTLDRIQRNASFAAIRYDNIRCARVRKFPYLVHYEIGTKNQVLIIAIYSTYQKPLWEQ